jgi:hypothetical protein
MKIEYKSYEHHLKAYILDNFKGAREAAIWLRTKSFNGYDQSEPTVEEYFEISRILNLK